MDPREVPRCGSLPRRSGRGQHLAALAGPLQSCRLHPDDETALEALYGDPLYQGREGFYRHMALREQLIALEVLADDL